MTKNDNPPIGKHILLDLYNCQNSDLNWDEIKEIFYEGLEKGSFSVLSDHHHQFEPHGVSGMFILEESHCSFHIWVELCFVSLDVYWCGQKCDEQKLINTLIQFFVPEKVDYKYVERGFFEK